jgi:GH25 family lysozyme M1 (1,4-beta-N-acetylmuramidase)/DNA-directed RNA polymerase subunit RPC12/RpoP
MKKIATLDPTCTEIGYSTYKCDNCTHEHYEDFSDPMGHSIIKISSVAPTCEGEGYNLYKCSRCNHEYMNEHISPTGHTLAKTVVDPTCTSEGYTKYNCQNCTYSFISDKVAPLEHTYIKTYVRPNIAQTGYTLYTCTTCESEHKADYVFYSDIFKGAEGEGRGSLGFGLDLSHHSSDVDFEALKSSGVDFVILRVGYYTSLDTRFEEYYAAAREAGLDIGVYYFTLAESKEEAIEDAERVAAWLEGKTFEYPIFYDVEDDPHYSGYAPSTFSEELIMEIVHTFMTEMVNYGYYPGLYTNNHFLYNLFHSEKTLRLYDVWYARYTTPTDANTLEYSNLYSMWQYKGDVYSYLDGAVSGACDLNYTFKNYPEIIKKFGFNGYP